LLIVIKYILLVSFAEVSTTALMLDYAGLLALAGVSYWAIVSAVNTSATDGITLSQAFLVSMYVALVAAIMVGGFLYVYTKYLDPTHGDRMVLKTIEYMKVRKYSEAEIEKGIANAKTFYSPVSQFLSGVSVIVYGLFVSIVVAALARKTKRIVQL